MNCEGFFLLIHVEVFHRGRILYEMFCLLETEPKLCSYLHLPGWRANHFTYPSGLQRLLAIIAPPQGLRKNHLPCPTSFSMYFMFFRKHWARLGLMLCRFNQKSVSVESTLFCSWKHFWVGGKKKISLGLNARLQMKHAVKYENRQRKENPLKSGFNVISSFFSKCESSLWCSEALRICFSRL